MCLAAVRAGAAGFTRHEVEVRGRRFDARGRSEGYNHLHMKLLGDLQLLYNLVAWAQWRHVRPIALRAMASSCFDSRGCRRAGRRSVRALRTSKRHRGLLHCAYWLKLFEVVCSRVVMR